MRSNPNLIHSPSQNLFNYGKLKPSCDDKTHSEQYPINISQLKLTSVKSANLTSMSNQELLELVWEDGQLLTRGFSKRTQKSTTSCIDHASHSSNAPLENRRDTETFPPKRPKFWTSDSIIGNNSSLKNDKQLLELLYKSHFDAFSEHATGYNSGYDDKLPKDSQVVPVHETTPTPTGIRQSHDSTPLKRATAKYSPNLLSSDVLKREPEKKREQPVNFSLFLRSPALRTSGRRGFSRAEPEKLQNKPLLLSPAANGSASVKGFQNQLNSVDINAELLQPVPVPDIQLEPDCSRTSSLPAENTVKGKLGAGKCIEPPVPSSSLCSLGASSNNPACNAFNVKRRYEDTKGSACPSDQNEEKLERKAVTVRVSKSHQKKRTPEVHNLYEQKRRDKINKKMRALQELIPNCTKVDKASMLDEAIDYLKTLQFQVMMMSMGAGVCMPSMMLPTGIIGMQQIRAVAPQMSHFPPMGIGMGMRMQMGGGCKPAQFLMPPIPEATAVPGIQMPGFPGQPLPMSMLGTPLGLMHKTIPVAGVPRAAASMELKDSAPLTNPKDSIQNEEINKRNVDHSKIRPSA